MLPRTALLALFFVVCSLFSASLAQVNFTVTSVTIDNPNNVQGILPTSVVTVNVAGNPSVRFGTGQGGDMSLFFNNVDLTGLVQDGDMSPFYPISNGYNTYTVCNSTGGVIYTTVTSYDGPRLITVICWVTYCTITEQTTYALGFGLQQPFLNESITLSIDNFPSLTGSAGVGLFVLGAEMNMYLMPYQDDVVLNTLVLTSSNTNANTTVLPYFSTITSTADVADGNTVNVFGLINPNLTYACVFRSLQPALNIITSYQYPNGNSLNCILPSNLSSILTEAQALALIDVVCEDPSYIVYAPFLNTNPQGVTFHPAGTTSSHSSTTGGSSNPIHGLSSRDKVYIGVGVTLAIVFIAVVAVIAHRRHRRHHYSHIHH